MLLEWCPLCRIGSQVQPKTKIIIIMNVEASNVDVVLQVGVVEVL